MRNEEAKLILEQYIPNDSRGNGKSMQTLKLTEAFLLAIKALEEIPKWIPVGERLPKDGQVCLVTTKGMLGDVYCEIETYANNLYNVDEFDFYDKKNV